MITQKKVAVFDGLAELCLKVLLFAFVLCGVSVLTFFFIYFVVKDKGGQAKAIIGYGDAVFFTAFAKLIWYFFPKKQPADSRRTLHEKRAIREREHAG
jgi:hypothetical protein